MITLPHLYHWSPAARRASIQKHGLLINSDNTIATKSGDYICLGTTPKTAWLHSVGTLLMSGKKLPSQSPEETWDLWQVSISPGMAIYVQPTYGPELAEVRVHGDIPPSRLWLCGNRYGSW